MAVLRIVSMTRINLKEMLLGVIAELQKQWKGKLQKNFIRILEGDNVKIGMSPYDLTKGIITYRNKN